MCVTLVSYLDMGTERQLPDSLVERNRHLVRPKAAALFLLHGYNNRPSMSQSDYIFAASIF